MGRLNLPDQFKQWGEKPAVWIIAGGLLLLAFLLFVIAVLASETYERVYHDYAASEAQANAENIFDRECAKRTTIGDVLSCSKEAVKAARETQRSEEDLYAQKQMAQWAFWLLLLTGFIGVVSIAITGVGTYFLLRTVGLSGEANAVAREVGEAQVRAYLAITKAEIWYDFLHLKPRLLLWVKNSGQSPALDVAMIYQFISHAQSAAAEQLARKMVRVYPLAKQIAANTEEFFEIPMPEGTARKNRSAVPPDNIGLTIEGMMEFSTVFGKKRFEAERDCVFVLVGNFSSKFFLDQIDVRKPKVTKPMTLYTQLLPSWIVNYRKVLEFAEKSQKRRINYPETADINVIVAPEAEASKENHPSKS